MITKLIIGEAVFLIVFGVGIYKHCLRKERLSKSNK